MILDLDSEHIVFWIKLIVTICIIVGCLYYSIKYIRHARIFQDTPTSKLRSAAQGFVQIEGKQKCIEHSPIFSFLTNSKCTWYRYTIWKKVKDKDTYRWSRVEGGVSDNLFIVDDNTGYCLIDPTKADVYCNHSQTWYGYTKYPNPIKCNKGILDWLFHSTTGQYKYCEELMLEDTEIYAIGMLNTVRAEINPFDKKAHIQDEEIKKIINNWKKDYTSLLVKYDQNNDLKLDAKEWENVLNSARKEIDNTTKPSNHLTNINLLSNQGLPSRRPFILSTFPQNKIVRNLKIKAGFTIAAMIFSIVYLITLIG